MIRRNRIERLADTLKPVRSARVVVVALVLLFFAGGLAPLAAQVQVRQGQSLDSWFIAANDAYGRGDFKEAARLYRLSIKNGEREVFSWFNLGNTLVQLDRRPLAMVAYRRCLELAPDYVRAWVQLGDLLFLGGSHPEAVVAYTRALELGGVDEAHVRYALGEIALANGAWIDAQFHFERVLTFDLDRSEIWFALAAAYEGLNDLEGAEETLKQALERAPSAGADTWFQLAFLRDRRGDRSGVKQALEEGLILDPSRHPFRRWLARIWVEEAAPWMGIFILEEGLARGDDPDLRLELGNLLFEQDRLDEALIHYRHLAGRGDPLGRAGVENVSNSYWNRGDTLRARSIR